MDSFVKLARFTPPEIVIHLHKTLRSRTGIDFRTHGLHVKVPKFVEICKFNEIEVQRRKWMEKWCMEYCHFNEISQLTAGSSRSLIWVELY